MLSENNIDDCMKNEILYHVTLSHNCQVFGQTRPLHAARSSYKYDNCTHHIPLATHRNRQTSTEK